MFRCIRLHPDDQLYQVILWREHPSQPIHFCKLKTVTYGMSCSPYLASRTLHQLADDEQITFPIASNILKTDTYVDDVLSGADTLEEGLKAQAELLNLLKGANFKLRKWTSNCTALLVHLPPELVESSLKWQPSEFSVLGLHWDSDRDTFYLRLDLKPEEHPELTMRTVLRQIAQFFDPLGFFAPVIITAKIFMQSLWLTGLDWDDPLTPEDSTKWKSFYNSLSSLSSKGIPRWIGFTTSSVCQLHAFADASPRAYGAAVYLRSQSNNGIMTALIAAKTRVSPIKLVSLPRLELCAAQLAAQLTAKITEALKIETLSTFLWSDSTIVLSWIHSHPGRWKIYVANQVSTIQNLLPGAKWKYVPTTENPLHWKFKQRKDHRPLQFFKPQRYFVDQGTTWKFNPGNAPHFGGLWETTVKSVKHHLKRVIGETLLTYEEMSALLTQIEGILNSRPLLPLSDDPEDLNILTPNHFLIGSNLNHLPEPNLAHLPVSRLSKWQFIQRCRDTFWKQWSNEYLQHLQQRNKWRIPKPKPESGRLSTGSERQYTSSSMAIGKSRGSSPRF